VSKVTISVVEIDSRDAQSPLSSTGRMLDDPIKKKLSFSGHLAEFHDRFKS
jgi:hypothetical protein